MIRTPYFTAASPRAELLSERLRHMLDVLPRRGLSDDDRNALVADILVCILAAKRMERALAAVDAADEALRRVGAV